MANSFIALKRIARAALPRLQDNLVMPNLCYRDYSDTFGSLGKTIQVRKPTVLEAQDFTIGTPVNYQDIKEDSVDVTLDKIATVDVSIEAIEAALNMDEAKYVADFVEPAAAALAEKINKAGLECYKEIGNHAGTKGTTPSGLSDFATARKVLNQNKVPFSGRVAVWDTEADAAFSQIANLTKVNEAGSPSALREGEIGRLFGIDNYMSQAVATPAASITAANTVKLNGATTAGSSTTLSIDATTLTGKLSVGDIIVIDGVNYTVKVESAAASSNAIAGIQVNEPIHSHSDNADVTIISGGTQNLVFHRNAIAFVTRPLKAPDGAASYTVSNNGLSLRVVLGYDIDNKKEKMSMDILYNYKVVYPELALRYLG